MGLGRGGGNLDTDPCLPPPPPPRPVKTPVLRSKTQRFAALQRVSLQRLRLVGRLRCQSAAIICCQADFPAMPFTPHHRYWSLPAPGFSEDSAVLSEDLVSTDATQSF